MTTTAATVEHIDLVSELFADLTRARWSLEQARSARRRKDTPANRALVAGALHRIDILLDLLLDLERN